MAITEAVAVVTLPVTAEGNRYGRIEAPADCSQVARINRSFDVVCIHEVDLPVAS